MKSLDQTLCIHNKFSQLPCIAYDITISFQEVESENSRQGVRSKMEMSSSVDRYLHIPYRNKIFSTSSPPPFSGTRNSIGGSWNITSYISEWHRLNFCCSTWPRIFLFSFSVPNYHSIRALNYLKIHGP